MRRLPKVKGLPFSTANYRVWFGAAVSLVCLWLVSRSIQWDQFILALKSVQIPLVVTAIAFLGAALIARALRWQVLLRPIAKLPVSDSFAYIVIGYMANNLLPLRAGEVIRAVFLGEKRKVSKVAIFATIVVERIFDIISLFLFVALLVLVMEIPPTFQRGIWAIVTVATGAILGLWVASLKGSEAPWIANLTLGFLPDTIRTKMAGIARTFIESLQTLHSWRHFLAITLYSVAAWVLVILEVSFFLRATNLSLPWYAAVLVVVVLNLGTMMPSSPGFIGVAHFAIVSALSVWSIDRSFALSTAIIIHGVNFAVNTFLGLIFLWRENLGFSRLRIREGTTCSADTGAEAESHG